MTFQGRDFAFDSPASAVAGLIVRIAARARGVQAVPLAEARGRVLADPIRLDRDSPPFSASAMDGYAVSASTIERVLAAAGDGPVKLTIVGESRVGFEPPDLASTPLPLGWAVRIVTGAGVPPGADAIIRREDAVESSSGAVLVSREAARRVQAGDHVRHRGENAAAGAVVLEAGSVLTPAAIGLLASVGFSAPRVFGAVRVSVITTGDECVPCEGSPTPFQIRDSNGPAITAMLRSQRWIDVPSVSHVGDDDDGALESQIREVSSFADALILTGGVSMGHRDRVRSALEGLGAQIVFHGLPQRPGKPMLAASVPRSDRTSCVVFGLPGNPVSAMVTCTRIVLPVLAALGGATRTPPTLSPRFVSLADPDDTTLNLWWHRLVRLDAEGRVRLVDSRGSGDVIAAGRSDGFVEIPPSTRGRDLGSSAPFFAWPT